MPEHNTPSGFTRRTFLAATAVATATTSVGLAAGTTGAQAAMSGAADATTPRAAGAVDPARVQWVVFDHHVHSFYSHDAKYAMTTILDNAQRFGVGAIAFTEHSNFGHANTGGIFNAAREIEVARAARPDLLVFQGLEWYIPAAEHGTVLVAPGPQVTQILRRFELLFDGKLNKWDKPDPATDQAAEYLQHAVEGIQWLAQQRDEGLIDDVLVLANHPCRLGIDSPAELRAWQDADPDIFIGMEGAPGAQASGLATNTSDATQRGEYENAPGTYSYAGFPEVAYRLHGGFDWMTAVVGGMWDSLLSEGRRWWITTNSDLHLKNLDTVRVGDFPTGDNWEAGLTLGNFNRAGRRPEPIATSDPQFGSDLWPGEFSRNHVGVTDRTHRGLMSAVRAGRVWVDHGHLISGLSVALRSVDDTAVTATLGETLTVASGTALELVIDVEPTTTPNSYGILPRLAHLDVIAGVVTGPVADRQTMSAPQTRVVKMLDVSDRSASRFQVVVPLGAVEADGYLRLRGSDGKRNGVGPMGADVDPRAPQPHAAGEANCWLDTWMYTNPIFVEIG
ncbi:PHP domain-containing protein [Microbacterium enclense]|uniref:PHP domain-containing protein n=1 Tax=Microbacterium enclense TaxID=993073 RepID=UPI003F820367